MGEKRHRQKVKIGDIANISSGLVISRVKSKDHDVNNHDNGKKYFYITQKSVSDNNIDSEKFERICTDKNVNDKYLAKYKDIIIKLAPPYSAAVIDFRSDDVLIPSNFAVIRIHSEFVSVFLAYLLNGPVVREKLKSLAKGNKLKVIKIPHIKEIEIKKRSSYKQIEYSKMFYLMDIRRGLLDRKRELEGKLRDNILADL